MLHWEGFKMSIKDLHTIKVILRNTNIKSVKDFVEFYKRFYPKD